jgi:flagellar biosynthesis/type III secretory pathway chaperone
MTLNSILERLINLLERETALYRSMLAVIEQEKDAVVQSDLKFLYETGTAKEKILRDLQIKEKKRRQLVGDLAVSLECPARDLTLTRIAQLVDEPYAAKLNRVNEDFSSVLHQVQNANQRNKQILEHSLELLRGSLNLLNEGLSPNPVYYRSGNIQGTKPTGNCVSSEI